LRPKDIVIYERLQRALGEYEQEDGVLPGIADKASRHTLLLQMIDSVHRVRYPALIQTRPLSDEVANPDSVTFEPIKAAVLLQRRGEIDEATWLVFLFVHFGKNRRGGWRYLREVYAGDGPGQRWAWASITQNMSKFRQWLREHGEHIARKNEPGGFGNHRKYESLDADKPNGTAAVVESYVRWIGPPRTHLDLFNESLDAVGRDPKLGFQSLCRSMEAVHRFGRTARFDYLAMLGKLSIAPIIPDKAYLRDATGPKNGAKLLFGGDRSADDLEKMLQMLDSRLDVGMQVLEDSLCNWQKKPKIYEPFRG